MRGRLIALAVAALGGCSDAPGSTRSVASAPGSEEPRVPSAPASLPEPSDPASLPELSRSLRAIQVAAGNYNACARFEQGVVACWGRCTMACDTLSHETSGSMEPIAIRDAVDIAVGDSFACAATRGGSVACWGYNSSGALGVPGIESSKAPRVIPRVSHAVEVAASQRMACARSANGDVHAWGGSRAAAPKRIAAMSGATALIEDPLSCCARVEGGFACIGDVDEEPAVTPYRPGLCGCELGEAGALRCEMQGMPSSPSMRGKGYQAPLLGCSLAALGDVRDFTIVGDAGYALRSSGEVWGWGAIGRLGERAPLAAVRGLSAVQSLASASLGAVFAVDAEGAIWAWGQSSEHAITATDEYVEAPKRIWVPTR
jgi:hypothetical protein